MKAHTVLVAFTVAAPDMEQAQKQLMWQLPNCKDHPGNAGLDSWYIAMRERHDGSLEKDDPSARFIPHDEVSVALDYDDAVLLYELLERDVCRSELVSRERRDRAGAWARTIYDAIDRHERGYVS